MNRPILTYESNVETAAFISFLQSELTLSAMNASMTSGLRNALVFFFGTSEYPALGSFGVVCYDIA